jgi:hypothetical protein
MANIINKPAMAIEIDLIEEAKFFSNKSDSNSIFAFK